MIFENSSPKGILRQIMNNVPKQLPSRDSQCYQTGALKSVSFFFGIVLAFSLPFLDGVITY